MANTGIRMVVGSGCPPKDGAGVQECRIAGIRGRVE